MTFGSADAVRPRSLPMPRLQRLLRCQPGLPLEENELLWLALNQLPPCYRTPLLLHGYAGYSVRDIAALLGCKEGTVKSRLNRGRALFQKRYAAL